MKKTVLRPKKEKMNENKENKKKEKEEGYLEQDLKDSDNQKIYDNVLKRIENNELDIYKNKNKTNIKKVGNKTKERNNRYLELDKKNPGEKKLRRKTVDRGGKYNNIQSRYIIYSQRDIQFHIIEQSTASLNKPVLYDKNNPYKKEPKGKVKVSYRSSCDNFKIRNKNKKEKEKTMVYYHCAEISQKDLDKLLIHDYILSVVNRDFSNIGFLRDSNTLEIKGLAPVFSGGCSLWYDYKESGIGKIDEARTFDSSHEHQIKLVKDFDGIDIYGLSTFIFELRRAYEHFDGIDNVTANKIVDEVSKRIENIQKMAGIFKKEEKPKNSFGLNTSSSFNKFGM